MRGRIAAEHGALGFSKAAPQGSFGFSRGRESQFAPADDA
jgi:hypothetical protein